jgi:aspartyl-tRNA synthetase
MDWKNRQYCGEIDRSYIGKIVLLMGWVDAIRNHGHILFIHLRDIRGIVQVVFNPIYNNESYQISMSLKEEYVVEVMGKVVTRSKGTENPNLRTGELEVIADRLTILAKSIKLPFNISEKAMVFGEEIQSNPDHVEEDLRLQFRYLDLRRPSIQDLFIKRYQMTKIIRQILDKKNFIELETPFLTRSTPEGARDFLVPSRVHKGSYYALPQSPQLFKQIFMISGMDRYFQIVRCFRDEDLRPNRQPEFTQLDLEASFIDEEFIYEIIEELVVAIFKLGNITLPQPFPRMTYREAMDKYGSDKPDLRFGMSFENVTDIFQNTRYSVFKRIIQQSGQVKGFCIEGGARSLSKNVLQNEYSIKIAPSFGAGGMSWMKVVDFKLESNIVQFFSQEEQDEIIDRFQAKSGDVIILVAEKSIDLLNSVLSKLRFHFAERLLLIREDHFCPLWVTNFPLFEMKNDRISPLHHPFTMPDRIDFDPTDKDDLLSLNSRAYDLVMNGEELGGGSVRIHQMDIQAKIFQALGLKKDEIELKFGFFLKALEYGAPPHAGVALGLDRVIAMILQVPSIREVIAFPKNRSAFCPLTQSPSLVDMDQLKEVGLDSFSTMQRSGDTEVKLTIEGWEEQKTKIKEKITRSQVKHIAQLVRLKLEEKEIDSYKNDLNSILDYVDMLGELDTDKVQPMSGSLDRKNVWREDEPGKTKKSTDILKNAPMKDSNYFKVPRILEG